MESKRRALVGLLRSAEERTARAAAWICGDDVGSRRSRRRFIAVSVAKRERDGGWRSRMPWSSVSVLRRSEVVIVLFGWPRRRSRVVMRREQRLWLNVSWRWKKVRNAGSEGRSASVLALDGEVVEDGWRRDARRFEGDSAPGEERHIWARIPSICLRPLRILERSPEEMFSNASDRRESILAQNLVLTVDLEY